MKIGFYSPYFDTLGGGERYTLTLASHWSRRHDVKLFWDDESFIERAQKRFDIDLSGVRITQNIFRNISVFKKLFLTRQYDLIFFLSDGSVPSTLAPHNILHFQIPFEKVAYSALKLSRYRAIICNSTFTKNSLDPRVGIRSEVIYPPVSGVGRGQEKKENIILSVGRFTDFHTAKKQHVLIEAFREGFKSGKWNTWKLILAGGLMPGDQGYMSRLRNLAKGLPVAFEPNIPIEKLRAYYQKARMYWHASGFGESNPRYMEHFGISTVEAMSAGAIPVVFHGGGQPDIVDHGLNGMLWNSLRELIDHTTKIMTDHHLESAMQRKAIEKSKQFSVSRFCDDFDAVLTKITL